MKKALMITSVASMIKQFNMNNIRILNELGYQVTIATNFKDPGNIPLEESRDLYDELKRMNVDVKNIFFDRNPINIKNLKAYGQIKGIINQEHFDLIHCQSPIGGFLTRLAARESRQIGTKVIYTAHGFHFYKGAPLINWLLLYPAERFLSKYTDTLITINHEDFKRAQFFHSNEIKYVPGVGLDVNRCQDITVNSEEKHKELGIPVKAFIVVSVGELNSNKNHEVIIKAIEKLKNPQIHYVICGKGSLEQHLIALSENLGISEQVHLVGYRKDVIEIVKASDIFAFPSNREGLGMAALEAMASGLPLLTSNIHGINDYSINGVTGFNYKPTDVGGFAEGIETLYKNKELRKKMGKGNEKAVSIYNKSNINIIMKNIYGDILN